MDITEQEIKGVLHRYGIGKLLSFERIKSGFANINYRIDTGKGSFLYRICIQQEDKYIHYELGLMEALREIKFPTAYPVERLDDSFISNSPSGPVVVYDYIAGNEPLLNPVTVHEIGTAVAKLNRLEAWQPLEKKNAVHLDNALDLMRRFNSARYAYPDVFESFSRHVDFVADPIRKEVPRGLVHGDVFPDNTLFKGDRLLAIVDFEEACVDNLLFDIGMTINGFCFQKNQPDFNLISVFLESYHRNRKITDDEYGLIFYYILWGAVGMASWHLEHLVKKENPGQLARVKELLARADFFRTNKDDITSKIFSIKQE